jgi:hypothetical protein
VLASSAERLESGDTDGALSVGGRKLKGTSAIIRRDALLAVEKTMDGTSIKSPE